MQAKETAMPTPGPCTRLPVGRDRTRKAPEHSDNKSRRENT